MLLSLTSLDQVLKVHPDDQRRRMSSFFCTANRCPKHTFALPLPSRMARRSCTARYADLRRSLLHLSWGILLQALLTEPWTRLTRMCPAPGPMRRGRASRRMRIREQIRDDRRQRYDCWGLAPARLPHSGASEA